MDDRQRLEAIVNVVVEYLIPDGISIQNATGKIIGLVDPLTPLPKREKGCAECGVKSSDGYALYCVKCSEPMREWIVLTDEEISQLRQAAEMALKALEKVTDVFRENEGNYDQLENQAWDMAYDAQAPLRQALAQQATHSTTTTLAQEVIGCFDAAELESLSIALAETTDDRLRGLVERRLMYALYAAKEEPTPRNVDLCLLRDRTIINSITQAENRFCDIERRLAVIETQPAPPMREWVGLTDEEISQAVGSPIDEVYLDDFRRVIAKLKEKNSE